MRKIQICKRYIDGYVDIYLYAYPLQLQLQVNMQLVCHGTFYLSTMYITGKTIKSKVILF